VRIFEEKFKISDELWPKARTSMLTMSDYNLTTIEYDMQFDTLQKLRWTKKNKNLLLKR
jgi:hypothetical protein